MHRFDEQFILRDAYRKMRTNEARAATGEGLRELKRSQPSMKQRLAQSLLASAERLEPAGDPVPLTRKRMWNVL